MSDSKVIAYQPNRPQLTRNLSITRVGARDLARSQGLGHEPPPQQARFSAAEVHPILAAIDVIAAHCDEYSCRCSATIRTARSRCGCQQIVSYWQPMMS